MLIGTFKQEMNSFCRGNTYKGRKNIDYLCRFSQW